MLPLITPLLLLQVGVGTYILNRIINPKGRVTDNPKVNTNTNNIRGSECISDQKNADADRAEIWEATKVNRADILDIFRHKDQ